MKRTLDNPTSASNACPTSQIRGIFEIADNATSASNACPCKIHFRRISLSSLTHSPPHPQAFPCLLNMNNFDLRLCVPFLINSLKSLVALPGNDDWDPFYAIHHLTWIKLCLFLLILALFSFTSINIEVPYTASVPTSSASCVRLRLGVFSLPITLSFMASVFFPQTLFWYTYPILVLAPFWSPWLLHILLWVRAMASTIPVYDIIIIKVSGSRQRQVTGVEANEPYLQQEEPSSEDEDLEANIVIVAQQV